jgi:hypothetical protein
LRRAARHICRFTAGAATLAHQLRGLKQLFARGVKASSGQNKSKIENNFVRANRSRSPHDPDRIVIVARGAAQDDKNHAPRNRKF